jgi:hypothetical protein
MVRGLSRWVWVAGIMVCTCGLLLTQGSRPAHAAANVLSTGDTFAVESLPNAVTDTELTIIRTKGTQATVQGKIPIVNGKNCVFCAKILTIKPNLTVPVSKTESFRSGSKGAKLKRMKVKQGGKESNGFLVMEGDGYFLTK